MPSINITAKNNVDAWVQLKSEFAKIRGFTLDSNGKQIPLLYGFDVTELTNYWANHLRKRNILVQISYAISTAYAATGLNDSIKRWHNFLINSNALNVTPYLIFNSYKQYWDESFRLAAALDAEHVVPSPFTMAWESVKEATSEAGQAVVGGVKIVIGGLGDLMTYLLIGGVIVVGVMLLGNRK